MLSQMNTIVNRSNIFKPNDERMRHVEHLIVQVVLETILLTGNEKVVVVTCQLSHITFRFCTPSGAKRSQDSTALKSDGDFVVG